MVAVALAASTVPAQASAPMSITAATTTSVVEARATRLSGMGISHVDPSCTVSATVSTSLGQVSVSTATGVTLAYGSSAQGASVSFVGSPTQVSDALAAVGLIAPTGSGGQDATVTLAAYEIVDPIQYNAANGHLYEYVTSTGITWDDARAAAEAMTFRGQPGYLASITSATENDVVTAAIGGAQNVWIGATRRPSGSVERQFQWDSGPDAWVAFTDCTSAYGDCAPSSPSAYSNWAPGEPTNDTNELHVLTNGNSTPGAWNDFSNISHPGVSGFVVEYGDGTPFTGTVTRSSTISILPASPGTPGGAPTAVAGVSSAVVTWAASTDSGVTGYTVSADPGPATCTTDAATTSCVIGAVAGTPVTFTVVTHTNHGDLPRSAASVAVTPSSPVVLATPPPAAPTTLTTSKGAVSTVTVGEKLTVTGTGFAPYSTAVVAIYSTPTVLATVRADASGAFSADVTIPTTLAAGSHHLVAYGVEPGGAVRSIQLAVAVPATTRALAATGDHDSLWLSGVVALLLLTGAGLTTVAHRAGR